MRAAANMRKRVCGGKVWEVHAVGCEGLGWVFPATTIAFSVRFGKGKSPHTLKLTWAGRKHCASQRSLHNAPIFRLLLKVAVNGTHQCDFLNFCGDPSPQHLVILVGSSNMLAQVMVEHDHFQNSPWQKRAIVKNYFLCCWKQLAS